MEDYGKRQNEKGANQERFFLLCFVVLCGAAVILSFLLPAHAALVLARCVIAFFGLTYLYASWELFRD
jgi:hypothetical protein